MEINYEWYTSTANKKNPKVTMCIRKFCYFFAKKKKEFFLFCFKFAFEGSEKSMKPNKNDHQHTNEISAANAVDTECKSLSSLDADADADALSKYLFFNNNNSSHVFSSTESFNYSQHQIMLRQAIIHFSTAQDHQFVSTTYKFAKSPSILN